MQKDSIIIFTDGSSIKNPGPGGYGVVIVNQKMNEVVELGGGKPNTTNNAMELSAAAAALAYIAGNRLPVEVYTDSQYLINGITKWIKGWRQNGWMTKNNEPVVNKELWETISIRAQDHEISWNHVLSHVGVSGNERADEIATAYAKGNDPELYRGNFQNYPLTRVLDIDSSMLDTDAGTAKNKGQAYSYVSLVDGVVKRHKTWAETEARVKGKEAKFRKALSADHEREILDEWGVKFN